MGATAVLFAEGAEAANRLFGRVLGHSPYWPFVLTPVGLAMVVWITRRYFPGSQGSGIPQAIAALQITDRSARGAVLSLRIGLGKVFLTLLALLSGASVGREGPTVQVGASIMHSLSRLANFPRAELEKGLILAGGAAGVAAAFNTPLAGVVFAIEEMSRSFEQRTNGIILTAVILAGMTSLAMSGNYAYFGHTSAALDFNEGWLAVLLCGIAGGLLGGMFSRILLETAGGLPGKWGGWLKQHPVTMAAVCGLALAAIGLASGHTTYGTGYVEAKALLSGTEPMPVSYGVLKMLATIVSYLSGIPGGIFAPSLAIGAGFGANLAGWMPYAPAGAVVILGMVAYFSGVVQAPITAFVIVMEMTDNHNLLLPLMAAAILGSISSRLVCRKPLYKALAAGFLERQKAAEPLPALLTAKTDAPPPDRQPAP